METRRNADNIGLVFELGKLFIFSVFLELPVKSIIVFQSWWISHKSMQLNTLPAFSLFLKTQICQAISSYWITHMFPSNSEWQAVCRAISEALCDPFHCLSGFFLDSISSSLPFHLSAPATLACFLFPEHTCTGMNSEPQKDVSPVICKCGLIWN